MKTNWMKSSIGLSVHWTSQSVMQDGTDITYREAVDRFDVEKFADNLANAGMQHCILTLTHAEQYLAFPNPILEGLMPERTIDRDLIGEIITALNKRDIKFIAYYNHSCNSQDDPIWEQTCGYGGNELDKFADNICSIVEYISKRYGKGLSGWWFDSAYSVDPRGPHNSITCDIGSWQFPWKRLHESAISGNADCVITINAGIGENFLYYPQQDYYAGETVMLDQQFTPDAVETIQDHRWICLDSTDWLFSKHNCTNGFASPRFTDDELNRFQKAHRNAGRMVTFNVQIDKVGNLNPTAIEQLKRLEK